MSYAFLLAAIGAAAPSPPQQWLLDQNDRRCMVLRERTAKEIGVAIETRPFETFHRLIFLLPKAGAKPRPSRVSGLLSVPHPRPLGQQLFEVSEPVGSPDRLLKMTISTDQLRLAAEAEQVGVSGERLGTLTARLPGLVKVFGALRKCEDALAMKWGKPRTWATPAIEKTDVRSLIVSDDYPAKLIEQGIDGSASVLLRLDETGKVVGCFGHEVEGSKIFAALVCAVAMKRGRFEPARDASGKPVASYYMTPTVRFMLE